ncbi:MAG: ComF family protein [Gammaproteobacteria bacterium]|nr:ComF family protein [Gammaproteobacteria bacterium]
MLVYNRLKYLQEWLLPKTCPLCSQSISRARDLCDGCTNTLPTLSTHCPRCATPYDPPIDNSNACGRCQQDTPAYTRVLAPFRYAPPIDRLIQGAKYNGRLDWAALLGRYLNEHIAANASEIDAIVPVPLHRTRLRSRGYNQSLELARPLAKALRLPLRRNIKRIRATRPQIELKFNEREKNVRDAFAVDGSLDGLRLAIVDDVMTSGATANALARCLLRAGANRIEVWVVARA